MRIALLLLLVACAGGPAGPSVTADAPPGTDPDAKTDPTGDAPPTMPVTCGGSICVAGQTCNAGTCTFGCAGTSVPGDYATLQTAIDALAAVGNDATICIGSATLTESTVFVRDQANHGKTLQIIGESIDKSMLNGRLYVQRGWKKVTLKGVHVSSTTGTAVYSGLGAGDKLTIAASKLSGQTALDISQVQDVLVDGTELVTTGGYGVTAFVTNAGPPATVRIENSYFRGDGYALRGSTSGGSLAIQFVGNTVIGSDVGVDLAGTATALIANSLFTGTTSFAMQWSSTNTVTRHNNALWNNMTNYGGLASDGANYLKLDCMLDMAPRIPALRAGSPCRNAGDPAVSSNHDFHGTARGSPPDLGAVETP